jgi:hypothetical protein
LKRLAKPRRVLACHLLQHHGVGVGLGEKSCDIVDPVVAVPEIERGDAQEALAAGCSLRGRSLHRGGDEEEIDRRDKGRCDDEPPIPRERGKSQDKERAHRHERETVVDDVERRPALGEQPETGQGCGQQDTRHAQSFQPKTHLRLGFLGAGGRSSILAPI